jgi:hypothetical protein
VGGGSVDVRGGSDGIAADCERIRALGAACGDAARELGAAALQLHAYLLDPALTLAGLTRLAEYGRFEEELARALDGPSGLSFAAAELGALDVQLRAAAALYAQADRLGTDVHDLVVGLIRLGPAAAASVLALTDGQAPATAAQRLAAADPELADVLVTAFGLPQQLVLLSEAIPDGRAHLDDTGVDPAASVPPRNLHDLLGELDRRDAGPHGAIDVRMVTGLGRRHVIVDITGTKTANPLPTADVTGLLTDGKALLGERTTYENGVLLALRRCGVTKDDDVMIVGHSEGGMVAVTAARDALRSREFNVTHVVTAGAPIGLTVGRLPEHVQVLALENRRDVVPHLDGRQNPDRPNVTTVVGHHGDGSIGGDHNLFQSYAPIADDTDASHDTSVRDFVRSARGYLDGTAVLTRTFVVSRQP